MIAASRIHNEKYDPSDIEQRNNSFIAVYYVALLVLLGVPMWYLTTSTYRSSLPLNEIDEFAKSKISILIKLNVISFEPIADMEEMFKFEETLFKDLRENYSFNDRVVNFKYDGYVRPAGAKEWQAHSNGKSMAEVEKLVTKNDSDAIYIMILPKDTTFLKSDQEGLVRSKSDETVIYIKIAPWEKIRLIVRSLLTNLLAPNNFLNQVHRSVSEVPPQETQPQTSARMRSLMTQVRTGASPELVFSLVVPEPRGNGSGPEWDFPQLQRRHLQPLLAQLEGLLEARVSSQIIYGVRLDSLWPPRGGRYGREDLTHVVNGLETFLGSAGALHFVCYLAGPGHPRIELEGGAQGFTVPRWGGVVVTNGSDTGTAVSALVPHLRALLGLAPLPAPSVLPLEPASDTAPVAAHALTLWQHQRTLEHLALTRVALLAVSRLLHTVANMVIHDDVALSIRRAVRLAARSLRALDAGTGTRNGTRTRAAFRDATRALQHADAAFFDPSLLELLYFQDDQKYGIYIPLFVPVLLPLVLAALKARRHVRGLFVAGKAKAE